MAHVWVKIYYEGEETEIGAKKITPFPADVDGLTSAVHEMYRSTLLNHCADMELRVYEYAHSIVDPTAESTIALTPEDAVPTSTTYKKPLVVIAPHPDGREAKKRKTQFTSPGSRETESRTALQGMSNYLYNTDLPVFINGVEQNLMEPHLLQEALGENPGDTAEETVCDSMALSDTSLDSAAETHCEALDFLRLENESETAFQTGHFQECFFAKDVFHASDKSTGTDDGPFFMEQQKAKCGSDDKYYVTCVKTGKPGGTSLVAPMDIEIKSDETKHKTLAGVCVEVLLQACKRTVVRHQLYAYLKYSVAFAVSNRTAWCVVVDRTTNAAGNGDDASIKVWRIPHTSVARIWMAMTQRVNSYPQHCISRDGRSIIAALKAAVVNPWACRVKRVNNYGSPVYAVTKMGKFRWGNRPNTDGIAMNKIGDFAIKLVQDQQPFEREDDALAAIVEVAQERETQFHGLGSKEFKKKDSKEEDIGEKESNGENDEDTSLRVYDKHGWDGLVNGDRAGDSGDATGWWEFKELGEESCPHHGAIFMMVGQPIGKTTSLNEIASGVSASLELAHEAGYLHCDIRKSNVLHFNIGYRLVDFGLSCAMDAGFYKLGGGAQQECVGHRIKECLRKGIDFEWTVTDDYQMLLGMITALADHESDS